MVEWFDGMAQEWSLIGAALISFAIALVVVIIVVWAILHWFYRRMLLSKDIQIEVLQSRRVRIDPPNNSVVFDRMAIAGHLDQASHVEFKNLVLAFVGLDGFSQTRQGRTLVNARFSIVGNRRD